MMRNGEWNRQLNIDFHSLHMSSKQVLRPLRLWPSWFNFHHHHHHHHHLNTAQLALHHHRHLLLLISQQPHPINTPRFSSLAPSRGILRRANAPLPTTKTTDLPEEEGEEPKSRNQLKREAKRAVKWGMDLASFSPPQIKLILKVASLDKIVYDALILVKKLGPDVREGRRRQFSYIGKLLRDVEPELMDRLIKATRDSDHKELQALTALVSDKLEDDGNLIESEYEEEEEEEEESKWDENQVSRWFDGLVNKDIQITNEVYSVQGVEFDRQELRKLVREVHIAQEKKDGNEEEEKEKKLEKTVNKANKALTRFLRGLSKRITDEYY